MQAAAPTQTRNFDLQIIICVFAAALIAFHMSFAFTGQSIMREQHMSTALEYAKHKIDLIHPIVAGANANGAPTILEFPLWQALTAVFMKLFGLWYGWGNVVALLFHFSAMWPLFRLGRELVSGRAAWWALVFYLVQPLTFLFGGMGSSDSTAASLALWFLYLGFITIERSDWRVCAASTAVGCLAATLKAPFFMVVGLTLFFWVIYRHRTSLCSWMQLGLMGGVSFVAFTLWSRHGNHSYELSELSRFDPRMTGVNSPAVQWWFGSISERMSPNAWARAAWRSGVGTLGTLSLILLPAVGLCLRGTAFLRLWLAAAFVTVLVFTNVMFIHWHYYFIIQGAVALLCARATVELEGPVWSAVPLRLPVRTILVALALGLSLAQGLNTAHWKLHLTGYAAECGKLIRQCTTPNDKLIVWGQDWGTPLMQADRRGLNLGDFDPVTDPAKLARLKQLGFTHLVLINPSPVAAAVSTVTGGGFFKLVDLREKVPAIAREWPVVLNNSSLLILKVPQ